MILKGTITFFVQFKGEGENKGIIAQTKIKRKWEGEEKELYKSIDLEFGKTNFPREKLLQLKENTCYTMEIEEGFISIRRYKKDGDERWTLVPVIHITAGKLTKATEVDPEKRKKALEEAQARKGQRESVESPMSITDGLPF